jgi:hypothetical protein
VTEIIRPYGQPHFPTQSLFAVPKSAKINNQRPDPWIVIKVDKFQIIIIKPDKARITQLQKSLL